MDFKVGDKVFFVGQKFLKEPLYVQRDLYRPRKDGLMLPEPSMVIEYRLTHIDQVDAYGEIIEILPKRIKIKLNSGKVVIKRPEDLELGEESNEQK